MKTITLDYDEYLEMEKNIKEFDKYRFKIHYELDRVYELISRYHWCKNLSKEEKQENKDIVLGINNIYEERYYNQKDEISRYGLLNSQLQQRINKAIELIENDYFEDGSFENYDKVIELLKGEENENNNTRNKI